MRIAVGEVGEQDRTRTHQERGVRKVLAATVQLRPRVEQPGSFGPAWRPVPCASGGWVVSIAATGMPRHF